MKRSATTLSALLAALACVAAPATAAPDVGVTVHVSQPGVYGRIDLGRVPPPVVVYAQPIVVQPPPRVVTAPPQPVYLWVPPGHQKHWGKHCGQYNACGVPVYFVEDRWYREHVWAGRAVPPQGDGRPGYAGGPAYAPNPGYGYAEGPGRGDDHDRGHGRKWKDKDDDREHGDGRGRGHGHKDKGD